MNMNANATNHVLQHGADGKVLAPFVSSDDVARWRTKARIQLRRRGDAKGARRALERAEEAPTRWHERATLQCLFHAGVWAEAGEYDASWYCVLPIGIVLLRPQAKGDNNLAFYAEGLTAEEVHGLLVAAGAIEDADGVHFQEVLEDGELGAGTSRRDLP